MQRIRADNVPAAITNLGFRVSRSDSRQEIFLERRETYGLITFDIRPVLLASSLPALLLFLTRWVSQDSAKLLWIQTCEYGFLSMNDAFHANLGGRDKSLPVEEWPGFYFDPIDIQEAFNQNITPDSSVELDLLLSLLCIVTVADWGAKLIGCDGREHIEFWEGNIIFHSDKQEKIQSAIDVSRRFELPVGRK
ncbi:MAG: hypothetical protein R3D63_16855 [Paracoccaceae bacterium]